MTPTAEDLSATLKEADRWLPWPLTYTFDGSTSGEYLVDVLQMHTTEFVGASTASVRLTSKIYFKKALEEMGFQTPNWSTQPSQFDVFPHFVKGGHSVDSAAVRIVRDCEVRDGAICELGFLDAGETYAEQLVAGREITAALIRGTQGTRVALLGMAPINRPFIDEYAKHHNEAIAFSEVTGESAQALVTAMEDMATALQIEGYCRIDAIVSDEPTRPYFIDINLLPGLSADPDQYSYFPMAFRVQDGLGFEATISLILSNALGYGAGPFAAAGGLDA